MYIYIYMYTGIQLALAASIITYKRWFLFLIYYCITQIDR